MAKEIIVYSQTVCKWCPVVKNFINDKGFTYEERNVTENEEYMKELKAKGYESVPVTFIDEEPVIGFDVAKLNQLLG